MINNQHKSCYSIIILFQFECNNVDELASNNITSSVAEPGASKLECVATPWVRLFSRYLCYCRFLISSILQVNEMVFLISYNNRFQQMTQTCSLAILTSFLFLRLHYLIKLVIGIAVVAFYSWNVRIHRSNLFKVTHADAFINATLII